MRFERRLVLFCVLFCVFSQIDPRLDLPSPFPMCEGKTKAILNANAMLFTSSSCYFFLLFVVCLQVFRPSLFIPPSSPSFSRPTPHQPTSQRILLLLLRP